VKEKDINSLDHTSWRCQYHIVFAPKYNIFTRLRVARQRRHKNKHLEGLPEKVMRC